jgi:hypothetical protein
MGDTIWVDVQGRGEDDLPSDNSIMLRLEKQLNKVAGKLGVPKLTTLYDYSAMEDEFGDFDEDDDADDEKSGEASKAPASPGQWFDPAPALKAVAAIRQHLSQHPDDLAFKPDASRSHWPNDLMNELEHVQAVLEDAVSRGKQFRFLIVS